MSPKTSRKEFTEYQKAFIFARDKALCGFSGKSLRVLDYGLSSTVDNDRAEHIVPAAKGGEATVENGICASSFFNRKRQDNSMDNHYFFKDGRPTAVYYKYRGKIPGRYASHSKKFSQLHYTDWYFNRALARFHRGLDAMYNANIHQKYFKRDDNYYAKSTLTYFNKRKKKLSSEDIPSMRDRGLLPDSMSFDQEKLYVLKDVLDEQKILSVMYELYPYYETSRVAMETLYTLTNKQQAEEFLSRIEADFNVIDYDKNVIVYNISLLKSQYTT